MNMHNPVRAPRRRWWMVLVGIVLAAGTAGVLSATWATIDATDARVRSVGLAALAGLLVGLVGAFVIDSLDDTVRGERDLQVDIDGLSPPPVVAVVPVDRTRSARPVMVTSPDDPAAAVYQVLGRNLHFVGIRRPATIIQIASSLPGEGCTRTVADLAVGLARAGHTVVAVDADLRQPALHRLFATPLVPGLADILVGEPIDFVAAPVSLSGGAELVLVTAGDAAWHPADVLSSSRCQELIRGLAQR